MKYNKNKEYKEIEPPENYPYDMGGNHGIIVEPRKRREFWEF